MAHISDYDKFEYNYEKYWENRKYEDKAEKIVLENYYKHIKGRFFIDIGGSFGRHLDIYYDKFTYPIILDYSLKTLQRNKKDILNKYPNTILIAADAYNLPFKKNTIDTTMMIRVLHHLEDQTKALKEIERISKRNSHFILEYANKMHIKAILKWIITFQFHNFSTKPYQQPNQNNFEGTKNEETTVFLNYHPKHIREQLNDLNFQIKQKTNCSFLRMNLCKKLFSIPIMLKIEKVLQKTLSWANLAPSIIIKSVQNNDKGYIKKKNEKFEDILCCPICKSNLDLEKNSAKCQECNKSFKKAKGIWDLRT